MKPRLFVSLFLNPLLHPSVPLPSRPAPGPRPRRRARSDRRPWPPHRLSARLVTDRCDLRCTYCLPKDYKGAEIPANWLSHEEMARLVRLFVDNGVRKVRLTGGEPLTRGGVAGLAAAIAAMPGLRDLSLSTNGTRLARHARSCQAGVQRLNVSLDTLDAAGFQAITGRDCLADVLDGCAPRARPVSRRSSSTAWCMPPRPEIERLLAYAREQASCCA